MHFQRCSPPPEIHQPIQPRQIRPNLKIPTQAIPNLPAHQSKPLTRHSTQSLEDHQTRLAEAPGKTFTRIQRNWRICNTQELALGKSGKRRQWEPCYAVLYDQSLFLSPQEPTTAFSEATGEKVEFYPNKSHHCLSQFDDLSSKTWLMY